MSSAYPQFGYTAYSPPSAVAAAAAASCTLASSQLLAPGVAAAPSGALASSISSNNNNNSLHTPSCSGDPSNRSSMPPNDPSSPGGGSQNSGGGSGGMYSPSLLSSYSRGLTAAADQAATAVGVYGSYAAQGYMPFGGDPSAFYSPLGSENTDAWRNLSQPAWPYDPTGMAGYPYGTNYGGLDVRRKNATRESTSTLKAWLYEHIKNPYPTKGEKIMLAIITKMTLTQVSTWFANARRRLKKENKMQWSPRNRTGEDDDEDKDGSDCDDGDDDKSRSKSRKDDDEDINIVDAGNDGESLLTGDKRSTAHLLNDLSGLGGGGHTSSDFSHMHHLHAGGSPGLKDGTEDANGNKLDDKPRIWSLADVATSVNSPLAVRPRSPVGCPISNHAPIGGLAKTGAFSPPHHSGGGIGGGGGGFHPWLNGAGGGGGVHGGYNTNSGLGGGLGQSQYNSPFSTHGTPMATPTGGLTTRPQGGMGLGPNGGMVGSTVGGGMLSTGYDKMHNGIMTGDKHDHHHQQHHQHQQQHHHDPQQQHHPSHLSSYHQNVVHGGQPDDNATAFKPVPKRL